MPVEKIKSLEEAVGIIKDGDTIAIGGFILQNKPMALIREIVRQKKKDLFVICAAPSSIDIDMLIGGGCVKKLARQSLTAERMGPTLPSFRRAGQAGEIEIIECDQGMVIAGLNAAKKGLPSMPTVCALGADFINRNPDYFKMYNDPITGEPVVAVRAFKPNVTLIHVPVCDAYGHAQHEGQPMNDVLACAAAEKVIVSTDQIIPTEVIRRNPWKTITLPNLVAAVVEVPYGAHPCASQGSYPYDGDTIREYLAAARSPEGLTEYLNKYVYGVKTHGEYLSLIGIDRILRLRQVGRLLAR